MKENIDSLSSPCFQFCFLRPNIRLMLSLRNLYSRFAEYEMSSGCSKRLRETNKFKRDKFQLKKEIRESAIVVPKKK